MVTTAPTFTLLTKVLDAHHVIVLRDWLSFLTLLPNELLVYTPEESDQDRIGQVLTELARDFNIPWKAVNSSDADDLRNNETDILLRMVRQTRCTYLLFVNLDTLPYRNPEKDKSWLQEVFSELERNERIVFFSGCGLIFRGDELYSSRKYLQTQRFSNNFGLIRKDFWLATLQKNSIDHISDPDVRRYHSEWALEEEFRRENLFGLRRVESLDWRVFHVQQWDERLLKTRELFRRGADVKRYLNRVHEDCYTRWDYHYNYPKPPLTRRLHVWLGKYRRLIWKRLRGALVPNFTWTPRLVQVRKRMIAFERPHTRP